MTEHIVAVFDTEASAKTAAEELLREGVPPTAIRWYAENRPGVTTASGTEPVERTHGSFWSWLLGDEPHQETTPLI
jgi:hypothetical protein